jgi:DHA1 family tetracycline resistance protein-like MFS transporter
MSESTANPAVQSGDKLDFKRILPIVVIVLIDLLGLTIIIPLLPLYAASFGADPVLIGLITTAYPAMQFLGAPILGGLSDRYGRKPVLVFSQIGTLVGFVILGLSNSLIMILLARVIDGLSGANISAAQAALTDTTTEKTRTQGLGLLGAAFGLGFIIGPVIAFIALALGHNDYRVPAFAAAGFSLLSVLLTTFWFKETLPAEKRGQTHVGHEKGITLRVLRSLGHPKVGILLVLMFFQQLVFFGFESLVTLFTLNRLGMNASSNTILFVYVGIIIVMVQGYFIGRWSRRFGERKLIFAGLGLLAAGLILVALTPDQPVPWYSRAAIAQELATNESTPAVSEGSAATGATSIDLPDDTHNGWLGIAWLMAAMIPTSIGGGLLSPSINSTITKRVPPGEIGTMLGISAALVSGANAISPLLGGATFQVLGSSAPFLVGGIVLLVLLAAAIQKITPSADIAGTARPAASEA